MTYRLLTTVLLAGAALAIGPATARPLKPAQEAQVVPAGKPQSCIPLSSIDHTSVRNDRTIDFVMRGHQVYRNVLPQSCPELGFEESFSYKTSLSELCSTDIITVFHQSVPMRGASCGLGQFQPVSGVPRN